MLYMLGLVLMLAAAAAQGGRPAPHVWFAPKLNYVVGEAMYVQDFGEQTTWKARKGTIEWSADRITLSGADGAEALFTGFPHHRPGGSVVYRFRFRIRSAEGPFSLQITTNAFDHTVNVLARRARPGEELKVEVEDSLSWDSEKGTELRLQNRIGPVDWKPAPNTEHELLFVTVGRYKEVHLDGECVARHWIQKPWVSSEGTTTLRVRGARLELTAFDIRQTYWPEPKGPNGRPIRIEKGDLLFADDFEDAENSARNWAFEYKQKPGRNLRPPIEDGWLKVERFSAVWLRHRTEGPVVYNFECMPVPKDPDRPDTITDAIFFFQTEWFNYPFDFFSRKHYDVNTSVYGDHTGYWMDWGGNGNKTTRLRRLPYRQLLRQSIDPSDQLKPNHIHKVEMACAGKVLRFRVDGRDLIACVDPMPYDSGHFGMLGYVRGTKIRKFRIWQANMGEAP